MKFAITLASLVASARVEGISIDYQAQDVRMEIDLSDNILDALYGDVDYRNVGVQDRDTLVDGVLRVGNVTYPEMRQALTEMYIELSKQFTHFEILSAGDEISDLLFEYRQITDDDDPLDDFIEEVTLMIAALLRDRRARGEDIMAAESAVTTETPELPDVAGFEVVEVEVPCTPPEDGTIVDMDGVGFGIAISPEAQSEFAALVRQALSRGQSPIELRGILDNTTDPCQTLREWLAEN